MGNETSGQNGQYQRMGQGQLTPIKQQQPQYNRSRSAPNTNSRRLGVENAVDTLQAMFMTMDREVLRLVLMEQCQGNLDNAVEALLAMQASPSQAIASTKSSPPSKSNSTEVALFDNRMRPITVSKDFLQPPSFYLTKDYGLTSQAISNLQMQNEAVAQSSTATPKTQRICIDASIVGQWTTLMQRYSFKDQATMDRICKEECKLLHRCGSLVRVIFMVRYISFMSPSTCKV